MAQKPPKNQNTKPIEADRTVRLPRKGLGLEKDEPTQALQMGVPAADATLRLKRDEMSLEEPTVALKAGVPVADATLRLKRDEMSLEEPTVALKAGVPPADATLRLKRDEMSLEEPTVALKAGVPAADTTLRLNRDELSLEESTRAIERPKLRTAMEVIDEATQVKTPQVKPSVMMPDATDIPSWEETTQFFTPPAGGHADSTVKVSPHLDPPPAPMDPSDSMDDTFANVPAPVMTQATAPTPMNATTLMPVEVIPEPEEDALLLPDMHELDELPNAMKSTLVMPVMQAPVVLQQPDPMEATVILHSDQPPAPLAMEKTIVMPVLEAPATKPEPEPMAATTIMRVEPPHESVPLEQTLVVPQMEALADTPAPGPMEATAIMPIPAEDPSAYLTRQGQSPWPITTAPLESSPVATQLMSESLLSKALEATTIDADSALAPVPPEVTAMEGDSPLARVTELPPSPPPKRASGPASDRTVDISLGMAVTPSTQLMPAQRPLEPTVPLKRPAQEPAPPGVREGSRPAPGASRPVPAPPDSKPAEPVVEHTAIVTPLSVPGYPDRHAPAPPSQPRFQTKPIAQPVRPSSPIHIPAATQTSPAASSLKIWISMAIGFLLLVIGGIYFAFLKTPSKTNFPLVILPSQTGAPSLPVPADMQGTLAQAKAGDSKAMHMLGVSFYYGLNVPQNKAEGLRWMRKAAEAGNEKAKADLRQMESGVR
jgi:hypothetical protein